MLLYFVYIFLYCIFNIVGKDVCDYIIQVADILFRQILVSDIVMC